MKIEASTVSSKPKTLTYDEMVNVNGLYKLYSHEDCTYIVQGKNLFTWDNHNKTLSAYDTCKRPAWVTAQFIRCPVDYKFFQTT